MDAFDAMFTGKIGLAPLSWGDALEQETPADPEAHMAPVEPEPREPEGAPAPTPMPDPETEAVNDEPAGGDGPKIEVFTADVRDRLSQWLGHASSLMGGERPALFVRNLPLQKACELSVCIVGKHAVAPEYLADRNPMFFRAGEHRVVAESADGVASECSVLVDFGDSESVKSWVTEAAVMAVGDPLGPIVEVGDYERKKVAAMPDEEALSASLRASLDSWNQHGRGGVHVFSELFATSTDGDPVAVVAWRDVDIEHVLDLLDRLLCAGVHYLTLPTSGADSRAIRLPSRHLGIIHEWGEARGVPLMTEEDLQTA